jgi:hypothetical protein
MREGKRTACDGKDTDDEPSVRTRAGRTNQGLDSHRWQAARKIPRQLPLFDNPDDVVSSQATGFPWRVS